MDGMYKISLTPKKLLMHTLFIVSLEGTIVMKKKTFGQIKYEGDSFFVDNRNADKVKFEPCGLGNQKNFFIDNMSTAVEKACSLAVEKSDEEEIPCSLGAMLGVYEDLLEQAEEIDKGNCRKGELAEFISVLMNNLGKNALAEMFSRLDPKPGLSVFEDNGDYRFYIEAAGKPVDVNTTKSRYNLLLLDGTSVDELLVPEATVLVRLESDVEEFLITSLKTCCAVLKGLIDDGVSEREKIVDRLDELLTDNKRDDDDNDKAISGLIRERRKFSEGSEEYRELTSRFFEKYNKSKDFRQISGALYSLKKEIEDLYVPDVPFFVSLFKCNVLTDILDSPFEWSFDVPGFITRSDVEFLTLDNTFKIEKNQTLNNSKLGNDSFYVRAADLRPFSEIMEALKI